MGEAEIGEKKLGWLRGAALRSPQEASECRFLETAFAFAYSQKLMPIPKDKVVGPHTPPFEPVAVAAPIQPFTLVCKSPDILKMANLGIRVGFPECEGNVQAAQLNDLTLCRMCPFHEPATQKTMPHGRPMVQ
jgi:hypothetical protein